MPDAPAPAPAASPLRDRLRRQAEAHRAELAALPGLSALTYRALADRAAALETLLSRKVGPLASLEPIALHRRTLADVQRQLEHAPADAVPPPNSAVYAAAVEITELHAIAAALDDAPPAWHAALAAHLNHMHAGDPVAADERLALALAALLRRAGLQPTLESPDPRSLTIALDRWPVAFAFGDIDHAAEASQALRHRGRVGVLVLDAAAAVAAVPASPQRFGDDAPLIAALGQRLETLLVDRQPALAAAADPDHAFAAIAHATLSGLNVVSRRLVFAECIRITNLCPMTDPRIDKLERLMRAIAAVT